MKHQHAMHASSEPGHCPAVLPIPRTTSTRKPSILLYDTDGPSKSGLSLPIVLARVGRPCMIKRLFQSCFLYEYRLCYLSGSMCLARNPSEDLRGIFDRTNLHCSTRLLISCPQVHVSPAAVNTQVHVSTVIPLYTCLDDLTSDFAGSTKRETRGRSVHDGRRCAIRGHHSRASGSTLRRCPHRWRTMLGSKGHAEQLCSG